MIHRLDILQDHKQSQRFIKTEIAVSTSTNKNKNVKAPLSIDLLTFLGGQLNGQISQTSILNAFQKALLFDKLK